MGSLSKIVVGALATAAVIVLLLYAFVFDVWTVPTDDPVLAASIEPTLRAGDVVLVLRSGTPSRGDLIRCDDPQAPGRYVVARAIGSPGDNIEISGETVSIDGHHTPSLRACDDPTHTVFDPNANDTVELACTVEDYGDFGFSALRSADHPEPPLKARVSSGKWFLVSDNRHIHVDSRDYGQMQVGGCRHVVFRLMGSGGFSDDKHRFSIIW